MIHLCLFLAFSFSLHFVWVSVCLLLALGCSELLLLSAFWTVPGLHSVGTGMFGSASLLLLSCLPVAWVPVCMVLALVCLDWLHLLGFLFAFCWGLGLQALVFGVFGFSTA